MFSVVSTVLSVVAVIIYSVDLNRNPEVPCVKTAYGTCSDHHYVTVSISVISSFHYHGTSWYSQCGVQGADKALLINSTVNHFQEIMTQFPQHLAFYPKRLLTMWLVQYIPTSCNRCRKMHCNIDEMLNSIKRTTGACLILLP